MTDKLETKRRPFKIPAFWQHHWPDGKPSCIITDGEKPPKIIAEGWIYVFHPALEVEITLLPAQIEHKHGFATKIHQVDLAEYIKRGDRLSWSQRIKGIA